MIPMNILIIHNHYKIPGGEDSVVESDCALLKEMGHSVYLYTRKNTEIDSFGSMKKLILPFSFLYSFKSAKDVKRIITEKKIDLVMVHNTLSLISPSVYYAALKLKVPVIQVVHNFRLICPSALLCRNGAVCEDCIEKGLFSSLKHRCYRNSFAQTFLCVVSDMIHRATGIYSKLNYICLTEFNKSRLLTLKQVDSEKVYIKPNFSHTDIKPVPYEERENVFIYAGRLDELKGVKELFEAWKQLEKEESADPPVLEVYGSGPLEKCCEGFIKDNGLKNVRYLGPAGHDDLIKRMGRCKAVILLSKWYEGFPMIIAEAFSTGTPVIGTALGNTGDLVAKGNLPEKTECHCFTKRGALIDPGDITSGLAKTVSLWDGFTYDADEMKEAAMMYGKDEIKRIYEHILYDVTGKTQ